MEVIAMESSAYKNILEKLESIERNSKEIAEKGLSQNLDQLWLDGKEVSRILRITQRTLHNYRTSGVLPFTQVGVKVLYKASDLHYLLEKRYFKCDNWEDAVAKRFKNG